MRKLMITLCLAIPLAAADLPPGFAPSPPGRIDMIGAEIFGSDRVHSYFGFSIGFLGLTKVHGTFDEYTATILYDDKQPERSSVTVFINPKSIDTSNEGRDKDLQGPSFFDVEKYPGIVFQSTRIEKKGGEEYVMHGDLTIKGNTKPVAIPLTRTVPRGPDAGWGNVRIGGKGQVTIKRKDFGIMANEFWDKALSDEVQIEIDLLGIRSNYDRWGYQPRDNKPSIGEVMQKTLEASGAAAAAAQLIELKRDKPNDYSFAPGQVNLLINRLMQQRKVSDALVILEAARTLFPEESGFYARSGEAHAALGQREEAIRMYEKAASLYPDGTESKEMLRRLKQAK